MKLRKWWFGRKSFGALLYLDPNRNAAVIMLRCGNKWLFKFGRHSFMKGNG